MYKIWDTQKGASIFTIKADEYEVMLPAFSPDRKTFVSASGRDIRIRDVQTGAILSTLEGHERQVKAATFSPDGKMLASGSWDRTIRIWDLEKGAVISTLEGSEEAPVAIAFSPDGNTLVSAVYYSFMIRTWNVMTGDPLLVIRNPRSGFESLTFSPDGDRIFITYDCFNGENYTVLDSRTGRRVFSGWERPPVDVFDTAVLDQAVKDSRVHFNLTNDHVSRLPLVKLPSTYIANGSPHRSTCHPNGYSAVGCYNGFVVIIDASGHQLNSISS
jgi:WD40 repeat protein